MNQPTQKQLWRQARQVFYDLFTEVPLGREGEGYEIAEELRVAAFRTTAALCPDMEREDAIDAACGSACRLESTLILARDLHLFPGADLERILERTRDLGAALQRMNSGWSVPESAPEYED